MTSAAVYPFDTKSGFKSVQRIILCRHLDEMDPVFSAETLQLLLMQLVALVIVFPDFFIGCLQLLNIAAIGHFQCA